MLMYQYLRGVNLLQHVAPRGLGEFKVDSIAVTVPKRCQAKIQQMVQQFNYSDLHMMRERFEGACNCRRLDEHFPLTPIMEDVSVFRAAAAQEEDYMKTNPSLPERRVELPAVLRDAWAELSEEAARAHVLAGGSLQVQGAAGTGKSHWIANVLEELEAQDVRLVGAESGRNGGCGS